YSPDGILVSFSEDKLLFWDGVETGKPVSSGEDAAQHGITLVALAPDTKALVTVGVDNSVKLWNVLKRRPIETLVQPGKEATLSAAFSANGHTLALGVRSIQENSEIRLLSLPDGTLQETLRLTGKDDVF